MEKISEMIRRMCPEGVEYIELGGLSKTVTPPLKLKTNQYLEDGQYLVIDQGQNYSAGYTNIEEALLPEGEYVLYGDHTCSVKYINKRFAQGADGLKILKAIESCLPKYLFYALLTYNLQNTEYKRHWTQAKEIPIPLPPLPIQQEIVRILDSFTSMITNLETELASRQKQYEYYRNKLLTAEEGEYLKVSEFCELKAGKAIKASELSEIEDVSHPYPCFGGNGIRGYIARKSHEGEYSIIGRQGALCGCINWANGEFYATEHAVVVSPKNNCDTKFLFYLFTFADLNQYKSQGAQPGLAVSNLNELCYTIPSLQRQQEIVSTLDTFESLITNLKQEIAARKKQYEYYREQLLTFE